MARGNRVPGAGIDRPDNESPASRSSGRRAKREGRTATRGRERGDVQTGAGRTKTAGETAATVMVLPDVFGSELLVDGGGALWPDAKAIAAGHLAKLAEKAEVGQIVGGAGALKVLTEALGGHEVRALPYDWRGGIDAAADAVRRALEAHRGSQGSPVHVVAHGLGALGVLAAICRSPDLWKRITDTGGRAVLVAPPLEGSSAALALVTGNGRLFQILRLLSGRTATDVWRTFRHLDGLVDLLPNDALTAGWWDRYGEGPSAAALAASASRREEARRAIAHENVLLLFGAADATPEWFLDKNDDLRARTSTRGDGSMVNPEAVPAERAWYVSAVHEVLLAHQEAAGAIADLVRTGETERARREEPDDRATRAELPAGQPGQAELTAEVMFGGPPPNAKPPRTLHVTAAHGSLDRLQETPVIVGHYLADSLWGAEAFLDRCLDGRLRNRLTLRLYPGAVGSALFVPAPGHQPPGALVVGLGEVGELRPADLTRGAGRALLQYAMHELETRPSSTAKAGESAQPLQLEVASLLVGTRGGRQLTVPRSIAAITRGVLQANRALDDNGLLRHVSFTRLTFVELWADIAIAAGHAVCDLLNDASLGLLPHERIEPAQRLMPLEGARGNSRSFDDEWNWWRRLVISEEKDPASGDTSLNFVTLTDRARVEERLVWTAGSLVDELLQQAPKPGMSQIGDLSIVSALYEMLLPPAIKDSMFDGSDLVLVVDRNSGRYPWELLARRRPEQLELVTEQDSPVDPVVSRVRIVRQFKTPSFQEVVVPARTRWALVVGNPAGVDPLLQAEDEAREVAKVLEAKYEVEPSVHEPGSTILQKLFAHDYRIVHIAAHGEYDPEHPSRSGVLIGGTGKEPRVISAEVFKKFRAVPELVFLNCCHLGRLDSPGRTDAPSRSGALAASVAAQLMDSGVRAVVVAGWAVNDAAARIFATEFYTRMLANEPFGDAVHAARQRLLADPRFRATTTWGAYQCYGDPAFSFKGITTAAGAAKHAFVSIEEALEDVRDLVAAAKSLGHSTKDRERYTARLRGIEDAIPTEWKTNGKLLCTRAEAWAALGHRTEAVKLYRDALCAWDGEAPVNAAEKLANLLDRLRGDAAAEPITPKSPLETDAVSTGEPLHRAWLEWANQTGPSPERLGLRGGSYKRDANNASNDSERQRALQQALEAYAEAFVLAESQDRPEQIYYAGLNAVALAWASKKTRDAEPRIAHWIQGSRAAAERHRHECGRTVWNDAANVESQLLEALLDGRLVDRTDDLAVRYISCFRTQGDINQMNSVLGQLNFLRNFADERTAAALAKIADIVASGAFA